MGQEGLSGIFHLICFRTCRGDLSSGWVDGGSNSLTGSTCPCILTTALGQMFRSSLFCCPCSSLPPIPLGAAFPTRKHGTPPPISHQGRFSREGQRCHVDVA